MDVKLALALDLVDLDHVLDVSLLEEDKDKPMSELFLELLSDEMELNGMYIGINQFDKIEIRLRRDFCNKCEARED